MTDYSALTLQRGVEPFIAAPSLKPLVCPSEKPTTTGAVIFDLAHYCQSLVQKVQIEL